MEGVSQHLYNISLDSEGKPRDKMQMIKMLQSNSHDRTLNIRVFYNSFLDTKLKFPVSTPI